MYNDPSLPLIIQSDRTLLLDVHTPLSEECRDALIPFAELERSPEHLHTYKLTPLSLWNAASAGFSSEDAINVLLKYSRYEVPNSVEVWIKETSERFGKIRIVPNNEESFEDKLTEKYFYLVTDSKTVYLEISSIKSVKNMLIPYIYKESSHMQEQILSENEKKYCFLLKITDRGTIKQKLLDFLWPVKDEIPLKNGEFLEINLRKTTKTGKKFELRAYQIEAAKVLVGNKGAGTGFGTIVLPCGAGKTIVGMKIMSMLKTNTLIITTNISAVHQWIKEILDKTELEPDQISEYTGEEKNISAVTVATYQILTYRAAKEEDYPHFSIFRKKNWGLIIYDEVHMLPAPVFRAAAELQAVRRVGLTATLVREDGCEGHVFSLVGPKRYDVPWKDLEKDGWIATAECIEIRLDIPEENEIEYACAGLRMKHRIAGENPIKNKITKELVEKFTQDKILIIGHYIKQLTNIAKELNIPLITGKTPNIQRDKIYSDFKNGNIRVLAVSKVANFAIDLPDASMAVQISGTFGSRQEEAQRLGRILRPKERISRFFTLITRNSVEEDFSSNRRKFLAEQGYSYRIIRYREASDLEEINEHCLPEKL